MTADVVDLAPRRRSEARRARAKAGDFYETPAWVVKAILPHLPVCGTVLDPCAGRGAIMRALAERIDPSLVDGIELNAVLADDCPRAGEMTIGDALTMAWPPAPLIIMNPPFSQAMRFVTYALEQAKPYGSTVAALMRLGMMASQSRADFWRANPGDAFVLDRRPSFQSNGQSDMTEYAWFVWGPGRGGRWQVLPTEKPQQRPKRLSAPAKKGAP